MLHFRFGSRVGGFGRLKRRLRVVALRDIVPAERIDDCWATVIGVGAIDQQAVLQLAAIGRDPHMMSQMP